MPRPCSIDLHNDDPSLFDVTHPVPRTLRPDVNHRTNPLISNPIQDNIRIIGSMDAAALFPSVNQDMAAGAVMDTAMELGMDFKEHNQDLITKTTSLICSKEEQVKYNLDHVLPTPNSRTTLNSFIKSPKDSQFSPAVNVPDNVQSNAIVSLALSGSVKACMANNFYKLGGRIMKQYDGGSIGADLTNEVSCLYMIRWDSMFLKMIKKSI